MVEQTIGRWDALEGCFSRQLADEMHSEDAPEMRYIAVIISVRSY